MPVVVRRPCAFVLLQLRSVKLRLLLGLLRLLSECTVGKACDVLSLHSG